MNRRMDLNHHKGTRCTRNTLVRTFPCSSHCEGRYVHEHNALTH
nr:MAG TPA: hypothetical protein [Caudoviricetes sp.]